MSPQIEAPSRKGEDFQRLRRFVDDERRAGRTRLPPEARLTEQLGISRARLRGMLKKLEKESLIWRHVGKGTFIGERSMTGALADMPELLTPLEAFEARLLIEPQLAALAALRATPNQIDEIVACKDQMLTLTEFDQWAVLDERLHRLIAKSAGNRLLLALYDTVRESAPSGMRHILNRAFSNGTRQESNEEHARFVEAIAAHDPRTAEAELKQHLIAVRQSLFGSF